MEYSQYWPLDFCSYNDYFYWEKGFSKDDCNKIIQFGESHILEKSQVYENTNISVTENSNVRSSEHVFLYPSEFMSEYYRRISYIVKEANKQCFNYELTGLVEGIQFTKYKVGDFFKKHTDTSKTITRKLSLSILLSDPNDFEGGDLNLYTSSIATPTKKEIGYTVIFPSYALHEVTPVTKGTRYSLVVWITGPNFK